jgi:hypothetical protein
MLIEFLGTSADRKDDLLDVSHTLPIYSGRIIGTIFPWLIADRKLND